MDQATRNRYGTTTILGYKLIDNDFTIFKFSFGIRFGTSKHSRLALLRYALLGELDIMIEGCSGFWLESLSRERNRAQQPCENCDSNATHIHFFTTYMMSLRCNPPAQRSFGSEFLKL